jgi:hypothetical protein
MKEYAEELEILLRCHESLNYCETYCETKVRIWNRILKITQILEKG